MAARVLLYAAAATSLIAAQTCTAPCASLSQPELQVCIDACQAFDSCSRSCDVDFVDGSSLQQACSEGCDFGRCSADCTSNCSKTADRWICTVDSKPSKDSAEAFFDNETNVLILISVAACLLLVAIVAMAMYRCDRCRSKPAWKDDDAEGSVGMIDMKQLRQKEERAAKAQRARRRPSQMPLMPPPPVISEDDLGGGFIDDNDLPLYATASATPQATQPNCGPRPPVVYASLGSFKVKEDRIIGEDEQSAATEYVLIDHERTLALADACASHCRTSSESTVESRVQLVRRVPALRKSNLAAKQRHYDRQLHAQKQADKALHELEAVDVASATLS
eukprot:m.135372 g.135372  ORF g.135372 m.135372 type:complete len:335 (+) comp15990_c2_seq1:66-1070(+)